ncbi:peptide ABC transporter substrate-binding protein [Alkalicaulis satelles]|uniref:Peptide ABC transporter substrate-binding protein n=1 Tax=Alkalicaulis satelles TaxID=2609175 RepID=A0A5M6ZLG2_9PROT|nr:peptide ABC transporter substrate-binding protein [Alkalicaulis satelles]KAA5804527.1 peptide ABC transporter substrate-binding protein [Alkalicaulis satelles]
MTLTRRLMLMAAAGAAALTLAACGDRNGDDSGAVVLHRGNGAEPLSLDPHRAQGVWENNIIGDMFIGLFTEAPDGSPVPGMAESWEMSEDGLSWTFTLIEASWSDGEPVTADDFVFAFRRILNPLTLSEYSKVLYPIRNARPVNLDPENNPPETLGVTAIDERTLRIDLEFPAPYLPGLLTHYTTFPLPAHVVERHGDAWIQPQNIVTNGPYKLVRWRANDFIHLRRNELFWDNENVCIDEVFFYPTVDNPAAERRVRNGELDINADFAGQNLSFLRQQIPDYVRLHPYMGLTYFSFNTELAPFDDARVRNALSMAINREFIVNEIRRSGEDPAYSFVPPTIDNYPGTARISWADQSMDERRERARELLEEAGFGPDNPLRFTFAHRTSGDNPRVAPVVQRDWAEIAPWVRVELLGGEAQIHYANLRAGDFQVGDGGWIADYNDVYNFLFLGESASIPMNYSRFQNEEFDRLVSEANQQLDGEERGRIMAEAEQVLLDEQPIMPIHYLVNRALVSPRVTGWVDNANHVHRTRYLCFADLERAE